MIQLGIDIGGSGIKGALVDINTGKLTSERHRIPTPIPATPQAIAETINEIVKHFNYKGNIGVGFPAALHNGTVLTASNIDNSWIGQNANKLFSDVTKCQVTVLNDADVAGMAEINFGDGKGIEGLIIFLTVGTGIGTAFFNDGKLMPNTELGHIYMKNGYTAENFASDAVRQNEDLSWNEWAKRFRKYLHYLEKLFYPDMFIIGGGISKKFEKYSEMLQLDTKIVPAKLRNQAGIVGAAVCAVSK